MTVAGEDTPLVVRALGDALLLRLNRPRVRNALDNESLLELGRLLDDAVGNGARTIVIEGVEGTFCSGSDLKALAAGDAPYRRKHTELGQSVFRALERAPVLTVALVEGYCLGGGMELALSCDMRMAVAGSIWGFPEVTIGAIPAWGGTQRLPRFTGIGRAKRLMLTGDRLPVEDLRSWGIVDEVFPSREDAIEAIMGLAGRVAAHPADTFSPIKGLLLASFEVSLATGMWSEALAEEVVANRPVPNEAAPTEGAHDGI